MEKQALAPQILTETEFNNLKTSQINVVRHGYIVKLLICFLLIEDWRLQTADCEFSIEDCGLEIL